MSFKNEIIQKIKREFTEKEKYNILMQDYFDMIKKVSHMDELEIKYKSLKKQHKILQEKYTKIKK